MKTFIISALMCMLCFACITTLASDTSPGKSHNFTVEKICTQVSPVILIATFDASALPASFVPTEVTKEKITAESSADPALVVSPEKLPPLQRTCYRRFLFPNVTSFRSNDFSLTARLIPYSRDRS